MNKKKQNPSISFTYKLKTVFVFLAIKMILKTNKNDPILLSNYQCNMPDIEYLGYAKA